MCPSTGFVLVYLLLAGLPSNEEATCVWQLIDTRETINQSFRHPRRPLISVLLEGVHAEHLTAYRPASDNFQEAFEGTDFLRQIGYSDTAVAFDPAQVVQYQLKEIHTYNASTGRHHVRIVGIAPLIDEKPLCWFYLPECRSVLARKLAFSDQPGWPMATWNDVLEMRFFESRVIGEEAYEGPLPDDLPE